VDCNVEKHTKEALLAHIAVLEDRLGERDQEIKNLKLLVQKLKVQVFGKKSEKLCAEPSEVIQEELFSFEIPSASTDAEKEIVEVRCHKREIPRGRKPLPADLPRERIEYEPEERTCSCRGSELVRIGEDVTEELDFIPAKFIVKEHVKI